MRRLKMFCTRRCMQFRRGPCSTGYASPAAAADTKGSIAGRVVDSSGLILQGAQIQLQGKELAVPSNAEGEFVFTDLAPGTYKVQVSYVGFKAFEKDVTVAAGETDRLDVQMQVASANEEILVTAERPRGEAEAINRTRMADNVLQVLPAEVITSLPNANVADALGRLPSVTLERIEGEGVYIQVRGTEPRLTNVTIDGHHAFPLPSRLCGRYGWMSFPPTWWNRWKSTKPWPRTWMATASAVR